MSPRITLWTALAALVSSLAASVATLAAPEPSGAIASAASEAGPGVPLATEAAKC
jgi:hypothetical protein